MTHTSTEQPEALPTPEAVMDQAQVFASAWALYGSGSILEPEDSAELAAEEKEKLAVMVLRLHARITDLEAQLSAIGAGGVEPLRKPASQQAAHHAEGVPEQAGTYAEARECVHCNHVGINDSAEGVATCVACQWIGDSPKEDKCPDCEAEGTMTASCPKCHHEYRLIADATLAATQPAAQGMEKDAARYQWLRKSPNPACDIALAKHFGGGRGQDFDALIDAAIAAQAKQGGKA